VAVGDFILAHKSIPTVDPFSWTTAKDAAHPYIVYQWLSTIVFAFINKVGHAAALVNITALSVFSSFILIPLLTARRLAISLPLTGIVACLAYSAGSFHFPCRPEIISYLLLAILISAITVFSRGTLQTRQEKVIPYFYYALIAAIFFCIWANCHTGFVSGIIVLAVTSFQLRQPKLLAAFLGSIIGSLLTPYGPTLWQYLPHLFFSQVNKFNQELFALTSYEIFSFDFIHFDLLALLVLAGVLGQIVALTKKQQSEELKQYLQTSSSWLLLSVAALVVAVTCRRMVPLFAIVSMGYLYQLILFAEPYLNKNAIVRSTTEFFNTVFIRSKNLVLLAAVFVVLLGVNLATTIFPATLPQDTYGFSLPKQALALIEKSRPSGRMLNDPQFGDVLLLQYGEKAQVFIDTRFDMYGDKLVLDYWNMANCRGNWQELLAANQIDWLFFPPRAPIINRLANQWQKLYADDNGVILVKKK
jgi:hypothetical protein